MKVNRIPVTPVPDVIHIELSTEEAAALQYLCGRLSLSKVCSAIKGDATLSDRAKMADEIHDVTTALFFALVEAIHGD